MRTTPSCERSWSDSPRRFPERSEQFDAAMEEVDLERLASMAHQLKGTAGGYGYDSIGLAAAALEQETVAIEADLSSVRGTRRGSDSALSSSIDHVTRQGGSEVDVRSNLSTTTAATSPAGDR